MNFCSTDKIVINLNWWVLSSTVKRWIVLQILSLSVLTIFLLKCYILFLVSIGHILINSLTAIRLIGVTKFSYACRRSPHMCRATYEFFFTILAANQSKGNNHCYRDYNHFRTWFFPFDRYSTVFVAIRQVFSKP